MTSNYFNDKIIILSKLRRKKLPFLDSFLKDVDEKGKSMSEQEILFNIEILRFFLEIISNDEIIVIDGEDKNHYYINKINQTINNLQRRFEKDPLQYKKSKRRRGK